MTLRMLDNSMSVKSASLVGNGAAGVTALTGFADGGGGGVGLAGVGDVAGSSAVCGTG